MTSFIESFIDFKSLDHNSSPLTIEAYRRDLLFYQVWLAGDKLEDQSRDDVRCYIRQLQADGLSDSTIRRRIGTVRQFYNYLIEEDKLLGVSKNPAGGFKLPITDREESFHLSPSERDALFGYLKGQREGKGLLDLAVFGLSYYGGLRVSEGITRRFEDIKSDGDIAHLHVLGKRSKVRVVAVHPIALGWLNQWLERRPDVESSLLFVHTTKKTPLSRQWAWRRLKLVMKKAGLSPEVISKTSPHTLRHTRATDLKKSGVDPLIISRFLGHASINTTSIYLHSQSVEIDKAILEVD